MSPEFALCAQSLDNISEAAVVVDGQLVPEQAVAVRERCASLVTDVIRRARRSSEAGGVRVYADAGEYVVEAPTQQRDVLGRVATVVLFARIGEGRCETVGRDLVERIVRHLPSVQRTVASDVLERIVHGCESVARNADRVSQAAFIIRAAIVAVVVAAVAAVCGALFWPSR